MNNATDGDLGPWLALFHLRGFSLRQKHQLLERWGSPASIFQLSSAEMAQAGLSASQVATLSRCYGSGSILNQEIDVALHWQAEHAHHIIALDSALYPPLLRETPCPPLLLFIHGDRKALNTEQLAIVGSRNATYAGRDNAKQFAAELVQANMTITSGLALGIDTAAHQGAVDAAGQTVAVLGCGIDRVYPKRNTKLATRIVEAGAIVSEFPLGTPPMPANFPRRNRIISGLSLGVLVIEAAIKSGSLISANYAANQGREVFAIPGSLRNPLSQGCHWLIQQGAALVQSPQDILDHLCLQRLPALKSYQESNKTTPELNEIESQILQATDYEVTSLDELIKRTKLSIAMLTQSLMALELNGLVRTVPGGFERIASITEES